MALANKNNNTSFQNQDTFGRDHAQTFSGFPNSQTNETGNTIKSSIANPFDRPNQSPFSQTTSAFSKKTGEYDYKKSSNIEKFNIFPQ